MYFSYIYRSKYKKQFFINLKLFSINYKKKINLFEDENYL
jgi:hypothetical protein